MTDSEAPSPPPVGWREVLRLVWPALAQQGLLFLIQIYDQYLTGQFSQDQLAALTTANYLYWFTTSYSVVVTAGATAMVARMVGAGKFGEANAAMGQSLMLASVFGIVATNLALLGLDPLMRLLKVPDASVGPAVAFLTPLAITLPFYLVEMAGVACLVGAGDTRTGLKVLGVVVVANVPLAFGFSTGSWGLPDLGFVGIAWGTALSHVIGCGLILLTLIRGRFGLVLTLSALRPDLSLIRRLLRVSVPAAFDSMSVGVFQFVFMRMVNDLGPTAASAHGIAIRLEGLGYLSGTAFSVAAASLVGRSLGAGRPEAAAHHGWTAVWLGAAVMSAMGVLFFAAARPMFELFCPRPDQLPVIETGVPVLRLVAFAMPGLAACIILTQALRGAGDTRLPVLITWTGFLGVRLPLTYIATQPPFDLGLMGAWIAMTADIYLRGGLFLWRFASGRWKHARV